MTEERIKEFVQSFHLGWTRKHFEDTEILIRSVAAEARKEGIEKIEQRMREMRKVLVGCRGKVEEIKTVDCLIAAAERLKEQG